MLAENYEAPYKVNPGALTVQTSSRSHIQCDEGWKRVSQLLTFWYNKLLCLATKVSFCMQTVQKDTNLVKNLLMSTSCHRVLAHCLTSTATSLSAAGASLGVSNDSESLWDIFQFYHGWDRRRYEVSCTKMLIAIKFQNFLSYFYHHTYLKPIKHKHLNYCKTGHFCNSHLCVFDCDKILRKCIFAFLAASL